AVGHTKAWNHSYDVSLRANAKYCTLVSKQKKAEHFFKLSIKHSIKINRRYEHARTLYEYAAFLKDQGRIDEAKDVFFSSYIIFNELGISKFRDSIIKILDLQPGSEDVFREKIKNEKTQFTIKKSQELLHIPELNDIMHEALSVSMTITGASGSHLFLYDEDKEKLFHVMSRVHIDGSERDYSINVVEKVFSTGCEILTSNAMEDKDLLNYKSVSIKQLKSILCVPLRYNELVNGVCYLDNPLVRGVFKEDDADLLKLYLSNAALAIENKLLYEKLKSSSKEDAGFTATDQAEKYVQQAIDYLRKNLKEKLSRETVAKELNINADYFGKIFKTSTGKSFKEYLNEMRVKSTLDKLAYSDEKIIDIAFDAGFESLRTFYRIFYRYMGETPSSYREKKS
ncbi:MAG: helix-turn-helix domain-containing protein, partial [Endomicrobiales bacterium]|nr:helix-turn-helix domain-containing protein [Endomicrobiales bacterium]